MKAFITSGGARSLEEAVFYGVPIVGLPIVSSRKVFIAQITKYGAGEIMEPNFLKKETVIKTVTAVATQEKYKNSMVRLAQWTNHPVATGAQQALWWTEYVLRHGGARHLHSPTVGISLSKYFSYDIILIFFIIGFIAFQVAFRILRAVITQIRKKLRSHKESEGKFKAL
ncbi:UDP-glucuronosyltransferase 2A3 [Eumeta japonica]|uniref:UDP-glucuronosyltransferase 2A3 n=1 Tax=Eumeta variegata TaxID=151549 RepID=A0A4C1SS75_EUMVA|nr:UDP-glucuronosyltransferase 2A3 [Eumeta japonica]